jgi:phospholipid/cholesterol/gamma-HCH transport system substrate-binding protein
VKLRTRQDNIRKDVDPIRYAPILVLVLVGVVVLTFTMYLGTFKSFTFVTLVSDRSGLIMETRAPVKLRGVQVGEVASISPQLNAARLELKLYPDQLRHIPSNVQANIMATTIFGGKYVNLVIPDDPSPRRLADGATLRSLNVTVEVNTVFENLQTVLQAIDPAKLNSILGAVAEGVRGKGDTMGKAITAANDVVRAINPRMPTVQQDFRDLAATTDIYSGAAQSIIAVLDGVTVTADTINTHRADLDTLLVSALGFGKTGFDVVGGNAPTLVNALRLLEPTTALLLKYQPTYTCTLQGLKHNVDNGYSLGKNGKSGIVDATLLLDDDPYKYPENLPIVNAKGGPGGKPSCGSLPDVSANYPVKYLVTDTGYGTGLDVRPNPGHGHPWYVDYFPQTRAAPEPPRYRGSAGGPAIGPVPYPGAPAYGAPLYGPGGQPLWPGVPPAPDPGTAPAGPNAAPPPDGPPAGPPPATPPTP